MIRFSITGMSCTVCAGRIEKAVGALKEVESCTVSLISNMMIVEGTVDSQLVLNTVKKLGYGIRETSKIEFSDGEKKVKKRLIVSLVLLFPLLYLTLGKNILGFYVPSFLDNYYWNYYIMLILSLLIMIVNRQFFIKGYKGLRHMSPNMDTLVALGALSSFFYSVFSVLVKNQNFYFDSAATILTLVSVGKYLEEKSKGKTTTALKGLAKLAPKTALVLSEGKKTSVPIEQLKIGDHFLVTQGNKIPIDAVVVNGSAMVDESSLTGESVPVKKGKGDSVFIASLNVKGTIECESTSTYEDNSLSQMIRMVDMALATKAPIEKLADKVAYIFVPVVIILSLITFFAWYIACGEIGYSLSRAVSVLVVSCPCSLGLATPVAIMTSSGLAAKNGILFKNASAVTNTGKIGAVALDKTGTITTGTVMDGHVLDDTVKPSSKEAIKLLKKLGMRVIMLSGDKKEIADAVGKEVLVDEVVSEILPTGKKDEIIKLQKDEKVAMVGDGINDALALTVADIGVAIGAGTDVALDAADVVLMKNSLLDFVAAIRISRKALRVIKQNLFWAFFYNCLGIPVASGVLIPICGLALNPMFCALAMSMSSVCVVLNALRINMFEPMYDIKENLLDNNTIEETKLENISDNKIEKIGKRREVYDMQISVTGMMCPHCEAHVKEALEKVEGIKNVVADHSADKVNFEIEKDVADSIIKETIEAAGYTYEGVIR